MADASILSKDRAIGVEPPASGNGVINVAIFPYVPQPGRFEEVIKTAWLTQGRKSDINFVKYNCYSGPPPAGVDVFAFDAIFASALAGNCVTLPGLDTSDFFGWSLPALMDPTSQHYFAVPFLGCMSILIYGVGDSVLDAPGLTVEGLQSALGYYSGGSIWPPANEGLLIDFTGTTTTSCAYMQSVMEAANDFPLSPDLPDCPGGLNPGALQSLQRLTKIAGAAQATYADAGSDRVNAFTAQKGVSQSGRALVGTTETFAFFDDVKEYAFRAMPWATSSAVRTIPLYCDAIAINKSIESSKLDDAKALIRLMTDATVMYDCYTPPSGSTSNPQYLVPVRPSVLAKLAGRYGHIYERMQQTLRDTPCAPFRLGANSYDWLNTNKSCIRSQVTGKTEIAEVDAEDFDYMSTPAGLNRRP